MSCIITRQIRKGVFFICFFGGDYIKNNNKRIIYTTCDNCGNEVVKKKNDYETYKHHFCNLECSKEFKHKNAYEKLTCEICGLEFEAPKRNHQRFCSIRCQSEWQKTNTGLNNAKFSGAVVDCDWCGAQILVGKYNLNLYEHHFCDDNCRQAWYSSVYSQSDEWREESRTRAARIMADNPKSKETKPQRIINSLLDELEIKYQNEKEYTYYAIDNYLIDYNLAIEVMGDFWHANPTVYYAYDELNDIPQKRIIKDKAKHTYILNTENIEILYLWENDIYNRIDVCKDLILEYVTKKGKLDNYHSFNYKLENNNLVLNQNIIYPFFQRDITNA